MRSRPSPRVLALSLVGLAFFLSWQALALRSYLRIETRPPSWEAAANLQAALDWREARPGGLGRVEPPLRAAGGRARRSISCCSGAPAPAPIRPAPGSG